MVKGIPEFGATVSGADYVLRPGGYLVVRNERGQIAVVSTPRGCFLPGGGQDGGESPAQAAVREAVEECGLRVRLGALLGTADELVFAAAECEHYRKRCAFFAAEFVARDAGGEGDHRLAWMTAKEAATRLSHQSQAWAVREASRLRQTPESIRSDFDRIALLPDDAWDHNAHYHQFLISQIPPRCRHALEIGCGTGEFSRLLARRAGTVLAIDLSPQMIRTAEARSKLYPNIEFVNGDVMTHHLAANQFDCVATLTTLHHLPAATVLRNTSRALKPGGVFVCLDLYQRSSFGDLLFDGVAYPTNLFLTLLKTGKPQPPREVREAYAAHGQTDTYLTLPQIARICAEVLPGALVRRHLFWRYSIVWKK
ncbi:MAG: methyltransferase domain-containing protein [Pyrinomonadaceae bacterium]